MTKSAMSSGSLLSRRDLLRVGVLGSTGLGLADLLRSRASAGAASEDTSCILVWLIGGPSHLETYDMKPDAPAEIRGQFRPIRTRVPGMDICELLPRHAQIADKFSLIRSVTHRFSAHAGGVQQVLTGRAPLAVEKDQPDYPDVGTILKKVRSRVAQPLPQYVSMPIRIQSSGPAYLGRAFEPFTVSVNPNSPRFQIPNLTMSAEAAANLGNRRELLTSLEGARRALDRGGSVAAMDHSYQEAWDILSGDQVRRAFDLNQEDSRLRDRYGRSRVGQNLCLARRLVEAGVGLVSVVAGNFDTPGGNHNWDDHAVAWNIFEQMDKRLPVYDQALSALIEDIHDRGLEKRVLVLALGEFGRTPRITISATGKPGREHHSSAMSILVSGGGLRMGQVVGATDTRGERPHSSPLSPADFLATVYQVLGVDRNREFHDQSARPLAILPDGDPIAQLAS